MSALLALTEADAARTAALLTPALGASWTERATREELSRAGALALALEDEGDLSAALLGWVIAGELEINAVVVRLEKRRRGLGETLVREALRAAALRGAERAFLELRADNDAALQLYLRAGFTVLDRRVRYYDDGTDAVVMALRLSP